MRKSDDRHIVCASRNKFLAFLRVNNISDDWLDGCDSGFAIIRSDDGRDYALLVNFLQSEQSLDKAEFRLTLATIILRKWSVVFVLVRHYTAAPCLIVSSSVNHSPPRRWPLCFFLITTYRPFAFGIITD